MILMRLTTLFATGRPTYLTPEESVPDGLKICIRHDAFNILH